MLAFVEPKAFCTHGDSHVRLIQSEPDRNFHFSTVFLALDLSPRVKQSTLFLALFPPVNYSHPVHARQLLQGKSPGNKVVKKYSLQLLSPSS